MKHNLNELLNAVFQVLKKHEAAIETYGEIIGDSAVVALAGLERCNHDGCNTTATQKSVAGSVLCDYHLAALINAGEEVEDDWSETDVVDAVRALVDFQDAHEDYSRSTTLH